MLTTQSNFLDHSEIENLTAILIDLMQSEKDSDFTQVIKNNHSISQSEINSFISENNFLFLTARDKVRLINIDRSGFNYEIEPTLKSLIISTLDKITEARKFALMPVVKTNTHKKSLLQ